MRKSIIITGAVAAPRDFFPDRGYTARSQLEGRGGAGPALL